MSKRLFFSVGEPSGDLHASNLIRALRGDDPTLTFRGFGGVKMTQAGLDCDFDLTSMAVVGFTEVLPKIREFYRIADMAEEVFQRGDCDGVVLVDFPGFNWHIARRAKKYGLPVYYYLPPQLWAWGGWRVKKIKRYVDRVLCNLPFEEEWYERRGVAVDYVGHPFFDVVDSQPLCARFLREWESPEKLQVAVLPGSRDHEVHRIWPLQLEIIRRLHPQFPNVRFMVAALKDQHALWCRSQLQNGDKNLPIEVFVGKTSELIELADCALMKSGSVSMEMMARETPCTVLYHCSRSTFILARLLTRLKSITLPNMIAEKTVMPEFLAIGNSTKAVDQATDAMRKLIADPAARTEQRRSLHSLTEKFGQPGASQRAASIISEDLERRSGSEKKAASRANAA
ncbi:MAG: lipid-A-disaccharide synthase [Pirellulaceae bacterium]|nr:lipid-A-disaccharide synthase [Pirellulaceae bacterium]